MTGDLEDLIDEILVDAYGDSEQLTAFEQAFAESARFPFPASIVGVSVDVVRIEFDGDERHGLTAHCRRDGEKHRISLADLVPGPVTLETSRLLAAYRKWQGLPEFRPASPAHAVEPWIYRPVAKNLHPVAQPLALQPMGSWDPAEQYWGEEGEEVHPLYRAIIAAGPRPEFEMEQVIPGVDEDDWDSDPVTNAAELNRAGFDREARRILEGLIVLDERCIDAWVHLGNIAFDAKGPKAASSCTTPQWPSASSQCRLSSTACCLADLSTTGHSTVPFTGWACAPGAKDDGTTRRQSSRICSGSTALKPGMRWNASWRSDSVNAGSAIDPSSQATSETWPAAQMPSECDQPKAMPTSR
jgi:hypothetical protein